MLIGFQDLINWLLTVHILFLRVTVHLAKLYPLFLCNRVETYKLGDRTRPGVELWASGLCLTFLIWKMGQQWAPQGGVMNTWPSSDTVPDAQKAQRKQLVLSSCLVRKRLNLEPACQTIRVGDVSDSYENLGRSLPLCSCFLLPEVGIMRAPALRGVVKIEWVNTCTVLRMEPGTQ